MQKLTATAELLTDTEKDVIRTAGELWNLMCKAVGEEKAGNRQDMSELAVHVHAIQRAFMANAAARAYPSQFRLVGGSLYREGD